MTTQQWLDWLSSQRITLRDNAITACSRPATEGSAYLTWLGHQHLLGFTGEQTRTFLQGQLTCDVAKLANGDTVLGACCNPKGRIVANFRLTARDDTLFATLPADQSEYLQTHLSKYAAFFRTVAITNMSECWRRIGLWGANSHTLVAELTGAPAPTGNHTSSWAGGVVVPVDTDRFELWLKPDTAQKDWQQLSERAGIVTTAQWQLADIVAGIAWVTADCREQWIPQHLNWQALDGVSFTKGCYTGQEIVARMQYLGKLKSHLYRFCAQREAQTDTPPKIGAPVWNSVGKKTGEVVCAQQDGSVVQLLAVVKKADAEQGGLTLCESNTPIHIQPLPHVG